MYSLPLLRISERARIDTSEESLSIEINSFPIAGRTTLIVYEKITKKNVWLFERPKALAASVCPFGMDWIPALMISPMYAPKQMDSATIAATIPSIWIRAPRA